MYKNYVTYSFANPPPKKLSSGSAPGFWFLKITESVNRPWVCVTCIIFARRFEWVFISAESSQNH